MAKSKQSTMVTRKQLSRSKREKKQLMWVWISTAALAVIVMAILLFGIITTRTQVVAIVGGEKIRLPEYQKRARLQYYYFNNHLMPGAVDNLESSQLTQFYQGIATDLADERLIRQEAARLGVSVTQEEVQIELEEVWFQHYRTPPTPTPTPTTDPSATPTATINPSATPTATPAQTSTPTPSPTPDTNEAFQANYDEFKKNVLKPAGASENDFRRLVETTLLREKLQKLLVTEVPTEEDQVNLRYTSAQDADAATAKIASLQAGEEEQVHARHILVATQEEADDILKQLQGGADFTALAAQFSTDTSNKDQGGDLDWFGQGQMVEAFDKAAFTGEIGLYPSPVQTDYGFHIIEILGREKRPISLDDELYDLGWSNYADLAERFGAVFAEMAFNANVGLITQMIPTEYGIAVVEVLGHEIRQLTTSEQEQRRSDLFEQKLEELRQAANIEDRWSEAMVPADILPVSSQ